MDRKFAELTAAFAAAPERTIHGVVSASGASAGKSGREKLWTLNVDLIAWRIAGQEVRRAPLKVSKRVSDAELKAQKAPIAAETVIAFRGKLCESSPFGDARAELTSLLAPPTDPELESILDEYRQPVELTDPVLGKLVLDRSVDWFEGMVVWSGQPVQIGASLDENGDAADTLGTARALLADAAGWTAKVNAFVVDKLLALKNDSWLEEDEAPLTADQFIACMQLDSITVDPGGYFTFWHNDGDLFWGHTIQVSGSLHEGLSDATIAG